MDSKASAHPKLQAPMKVLAAAPGPGMGYLAIVMGDEPDGVTVRMRIAPGMLTCVIPPDRLAMVLDDPRVEAVQVSGLAPMEG